jgi:hypothetical protein
MAFKELIFERLAGALESTRGTAIAAPTHVFNFPGLLTPSQEYDSPAESRGQKWTRFREEITRKGAAWSVPDQPADPNLITFWFNMLVAPVTSPTQPDAVNWPNTYLWTFKPTAASDDVKTATLWWGDASIQYWSSDFAIATQMQFNNDANRVEGARYNLTGMAGFPSKVSAPTIPANIAGRFLGNGLLMQLWMDTSSAIGTTEIASRVLSARHTLTNGLYPKYLAAGPSASLDYTDLGLAAEGVRLVTELTFELPNMTQYDLFAAGTVTKTRVRHNGAMIDDHTTDSFRYVEFDTYGPLKNLQWGTNGGNRTVTFTIESLYDSTLAAPFSVKVQNPRSTL